MCSHVPAGATVAALELPFVVVGRKNYESRESIREHSRDS